MSAGIKPLQNGWIAIAVRATSLDALEEAAARGLRDAERNSSDPEDRARTARWKAAIQDFAAGFHDAVLGERAEVNANLILASNELRNALRALLIECDQHGSFAEVGFDFPTVKSIFDAARAALAKAEGRTHV
jgi:hypothetical protein